MIENDEWVFQRVSSVLWEHSGEHRLHGESTSFTGRGAMSWTYLNCPNHKAMKCFFRSKQQSTSGKLLEIGLSCFRT
jgi:hypothetical protein